MAKEIAEQNVALIDGNYEVTNILPVKSIVNEYDSNRQRARPPARVKPFS
jgi:hypothetical protein